MNQAQKDAIACLAKGGPLTDPKYRMEPSHAEERLKAQVKECWSHRASFPEWVTAYCKKWEAQNVRGDQRPVGECNELPGLSKATQG